MSEYFLPYPISATGYLHPIFHLGMQISETNGAKGTSERTGPSLIMNSHALCEPFGGYSKTHSVFLSDDKYTVLGIVSVTS